MMLCSLCVIAVAALVYFAFGFAWQGYPGGPGYEFFLAGRGWNWIASGSFFLRRIDLDGSPASLAALLGMFSVGLAGLIPLGSGSGSLAHWARSALRPRFWPVGRIRCSPTGFGAAAGSRNLL